jgi:O-antigen/teichoic acid export membrane protein
MGVATKQLDRFFVGAYADPRAFSVYATGALEIPVINILTGSAATVLAPEISRRFHDGDRAGALALWHESIRKISLLLFPAGVALAVLAAPLFAALYGEALAGAALVFQIFALALPLRAAQYGSVLLAAGETERVVTGSLAGLVVNVALCLWWVPRWAGAGAAAAGVISVYAVVAMYMKPLARLFACDARALFPWPALGRIAAACVPAAAAAWLAARALGGPWAQLAAGGGAFALVVVPAALFTGAVRKDDRARLQRLFTERRHA